MGHQGTACIGSFNTLRPGQNGRHFADDIFNFIFLNENIWTPIKISLKFVPKGPINNIPALVLMMAWRRPGDKPLSEPVMVRLPTHICVARSQWVRDTNVWYNIVWWNLYSQRLYMFPCFDLNIIFGLKMTVFIDIKHLHNMPSKHIWLYSAY